MPMIEGYFRTHPNKSILVMGSIPVQLLDEYKGQTRAEAARQFLQDLGDFTGIGECCNFPRKMAPCFIDLGRYGNFYRLGHTKFGVKDYTHSHYESSHDDLATTAFMTKARVLGVNRIYALIAIKPSSGPLKMIAISRFLDRHQPLQEIPPKDLRQRMATRGLMWVDFRNSSNRIGNVIVDLGRIWPTDKCPLPHHRTGWQSYRRRFCYK